MNPIKNNHPIIPAQFRLTGRRRESRKEKQTETIFYVILTVMEESRDSSTEFTLSGVEWSRNDKKRGIKMTKKISSVISG